MDNPKEIFEFIQNNSKKYLYATLFVKIIDTGKDTPTQYLRIVEIEDHYTIFGHHFDDDQLFDDVKNNIEWEELGGDMQPGWYQIDALFIVETDYDDYRSWQWLEVEHAEFTFAISLEQRDKERQEFEDMMANADKSLFGMKVTPVITDKREEITKILYQNSNDDSYYLKIKFEKIEEVIDKLMNVE